MRQSAPIPLSYLSGFRILVLLMQPSQKVKDLRPLAEYVSGGFVLPKQLVRMDAGAGGASAGSTLTGCEQPTSSLPRSSFRDHLLSISLNPSLDTKSRSYSEVEYLALSPTGS